LWRPTETIQEAWGEWQGKEHKQMKIFCHLIEGDCLEVLPSLPDKSIDLCIIDPPYSSGTRQASNRKASQIPKRGERWAKAGVIWDSSFSSFGLSQFANSLFKLIKLKLKDGAHVYSFIDWRHYPLLTLSIESAGLFVNNLIVWDKGMYALGGNYRSQHELIVFSSRGPPNSLNTTTTGNVLKFKRCVNGKHPTQKPINLIRKLIASASNKGDVVLDPLAGSGVTMKASQDLLRNSICIEIEPKYCKMIDKKCFGRKLLDSEVEYRFFNGHYDVAGKERTVN